MCQIAHDNILALVYNIMYTIYINNGLDIYRKYLVFNTNGLYVIRDII